MMPKVVEFEDINVKACHNNAAYVLHAVVEKIKSLDGTADVEGTETSEGIEEVIEGLKREITTLKGNNTRLKNRVEALEKAAEPEEETEPTPAESVDEGPEQGLITRDED